MLNVDNISKVRLAHRDGKSIREIALKLDLSHQLPKISSEWSPRTSEGRWPVSNMRRKAFLVSGAALAVVIACQKCLISSSLRVLLLTVGSSLLHTGLDKKLLTLASVSGLVGTMRRGRA